MNGATGVPAGMPRLSAAHFSLAAIGLMWTLPFLQPFHRVPLTSFYSEWLAFALGLLALGLLAGRTYWRAAPVPAAGLPLLGFIGVLGLQGASGQVAYFGQPLAAGLYVVWALLLMALATHLRRELTLNGIVTVLAWFLVVGGFVGAAFAVLQHYQISDVPSTLVAPKRFVNVYGNVAQYNHFANFSTLALASLAYLYAAGRLHWAGVAASAIPLVFVIGLSGSRSALLFLGILLILAVIYAWRGAPGGRRLTACVASIIAGFALAQWLATAPLLESSAGTETVSQRLMGGEGSAAALSVTFRLQIARAAWETFLQAPLLGAGWGQFPWHDFAYRALHGLAIVTWPFNHAHNIVLQLLAETGLAGTALVVGAVLAWLWSWRRAAIDLQLWWLASILGVIAIHSLLEHPLWFAYFLGVAAVAMGLGSERNLTLRLERVGRPLAVLVLAVAALYAASLLHNYRGFEQLFARGGARPGTGEFAAALARAHRDPLLRPYAELAISSTFDLDGARTREKLELNSQVMRFAPIAGVVYRQAALLALAGEPQRAARQFELAAGVYPHELPDQLGILKELDARHPSRLAPLLELATAKAADWSQSRDKK
jgi:O-antigen ligase